MKKKRKNFGKTKQNPREIFSNYKRTLVIKVVEPLVKMKTKTKRKFHGVPFALSECLNEKEMKEK